MLNQNKKIIILIIALLFLSSVSLFFFEKYYKTTTGGDWWTVYFNDAKDKDLDFTIENRGATEDFAWELWLGDRKVRGGKETIAGKDKKIVETTQGLSVAYKGKISVKIFSNGEKKEIYKNF